MSLPEFVTPVLSIAGPAALVFVVMRCFPHTARAVVVLLAGIVAIVTRDTKRRASCHKVLDTLTRRDSKPPPALTSRPVPSRRDRGRSGNDGSQESLDREVRCEPQYLLRGRNVDNPTPVLVRSGISLSVSDLLKSDTPGEGFFCWRTERQEGNKTIGNSSVRDRHPDEIAVSKCHKRGHGGTDCG